MVSNDVTDRLGIYKSYSEVPSQHQLGEYADLFEGRDAYAAWESENVEKEWRLKESGRVERRWKEHMAERTRHHALPTPDDVESFVSDLAEEVKLDRVYSPYWLFLKRFFHWMMWHTEYPHRYNPVLMACAEHTTCGKVWNYVMNDVKNAFE